MRVLKQESDRKLSSKFIDSQQADELRISLAMCRNTLSHNRGAGTVTETLKQVLDKLAVVHNKWSNVVRELIFLALSDIREGEYIRAYHLIDLTHNLTKAIRKESWENTEDESFFIRVELTSYIEEEKDNYRVKKVLSIIMTAMTAL